MRKQAITVTCLAGLGFAIWAVARAPAVPSVAPPRVALAAVDAGRLGDPDDDHVDDERSYVFRIPSGEPTALTCDEARAIIDQVRSGLAYTPEPVKGAAFATSAADWLDPHGLFSLAKDAPSSAAIQRAAPDLVADIEGRRQRACASADAPALVLEAWVAELREAFDKGRRSAPAPASAEMGAINPALEPLPPTTGAREAAEELGRRAGSFELAFGSQGKVFADEARRRFFPPLDRTGWARVVLASAVRAYVPLVDPHGEWAPFDEESRIYEVDLASRPPSRLWGRAVLTAVGVRITESATPPLATDDVVLSVASIATAGLPLEQVDQLGYASPDGSSTLSAVVLRGQKIISLEIGRHVDEPAPLRANAELPAERIPFGDADVLVVTIKDVRDDLGDELANAIADHAARGPRKLGGVALDLRGNGGGSTDGALGALSLFVPGAPLFAMKRRDGTVEIDRAPIPRERDRWTGPVATFIDGTTASAAEMIAGAIASYRRGPSVGTNTFGKGCAQEYVDDDAHAGVLRLTTLVYALPDGSPVQRVGLVPQIRFPFTPQDDAGAGEREAKLLHAAPSWRGPDVRDPALVGAAGPEAAWPAHGGNVGPCADPEICKALRLLGGNAKRIAKH